MSPSDGGRRCPYCGEELSPAASFCGSCQRPVDPLRGLRIVMLGLVSLVILGLAAAAALWLRPALHRAAALQDARLTEPQSPAPLAPSSPDHLYRDLMDRAEREAAQGAYRPAVALLLQAISIQPDRAEARARLERLRADLSRGHQVAAAPAVSAPPPAAPPPAPAPVSPKATGPETDMKYLPGGSFIMGTSNPGGQTDEYPAHEVRLDPYSLDLHEVTVESYRKFCAKTRRAFPRQPAWSTPQHPVVSVTWHDAQAYCAWAGKRLPTEAEWERAARCRSVGRYIYSDQPQFLEVCAWLATNSRGQAHPVASKPDNGCGFTDTYGNVWEWVADWYAENYYESSPKRNPRGPRTGEEKVLRGGAFDSPVTALAATFRDKFSPDYGEENRGFRCARSQAP